MLTRISQKVDYTGVRPSLQVTLLYWSYEILPCFLLAGTSFHFSFQICIVSWEKYLNMEILVLLSFLQLLRIFILSF